jgi:hypothetical protein
MPLQNRLAEFFATTPPQPSNAMAAPYLSRFNYDVRLPDFAPNRSLQQKTFKPTAPKVDEKTRKKVLSEIKKTDWFREFYADFGEEPDFGPNSNYDYVTAWLSGVRPDTRSSEDGRLHWSSMTPEGVMLKKEGHPTLWKTYFMENTGLDPDEIGLRNQKDAEMYLKLFQPRR